MEKIAVPTTNNENVDEHFGHCEMYTVFSIENDTITDKEIIPSPEGCGCKSNIASVLANNGVKTMLAGNIGMGAKNVLANSGIDVFSGFSGDAESVVKSFLKGNKGTDISCSGHGEGHECQH